MSGDKGVVLRTRVCVGMEEFGYGLTSFSQEIPVPVGTRYRARLWMGHRVIYEELGPATQEEIDVQKVKDAMGVE